MLSPKRIRAAMLSVDLSWGTFCITKESMSYADLKLNIDAARDQNAMAPYGGYYTGKRF